MPGRPGNCEGASALNKESTRKVDLNHLAFYRAWLQGFEVRDAANRYLSPEIDIREAKTALAWIREALVRAARRQGKLGYARLLRIQIPNQSKDASTPSSAIPSFEEFYEDRNSGGFYSESELLELYLAEYPDAGSESPKEKRVKRLIERQLEAIQWATNYLATAPMPSDSVVEWFDEPMAVRLIMVEIRTLGDLADRIRAKGYRWWAGIRQLGEVQGKRIVQWLTQHEATLGPLGDQALSPIRKQDAESLVRPPETAIMPMESFAPPSSLDGAHGENRALSRSRIQAQNDHQAVMAWLAARARNANTKRSYRREAERLILWGVLERGKALSSLDIEDGTAYRDWLAGLGRTLPAEWPWRIPQDKWLGQRHIPRWSPDWRPFEGELSLRSQQQAHTILKSMFEWLTKVRYLDSNPWDGVAKPVQEAQDASPDIELTHALTRGQWAFLMEYLARLPDDDRTARLRFVLPFAYATGLRLSELVDARTGRLYSKPLKNGLGVRWMLKVLGKGQKWRAVPMPSSVMDALKVYLAWRGLDALPANNPDDTPLIGSLRSERPGALGHGALHKAMKGFFENASLQLRDRGHEDDASKVSRATTHWLRHTRGSHSAEKMPLNLVQRLLGHTSLTTTSIYTSVDEEELYEAMEKELK